MSTKPIQAPILLKPEVIPSDVELGVVTRDGNGNQMPASLLLRLRSTGETLVVFSQFESWSAGGMAEPIDFIEFADGTVWDRAEIDRRAHLIEGTAGDDQLIGTAGNDVLDGGAGNDLLAGDLGSDTYMFGQGSGHDQIYNHEPEGMAVPDRILLKPEVTAADVELRVVTVDANGWSIPPSLQLRLKSTGETLLVREHFWTPAGGLNTAAIDSIEFADGTVWDQAEIDRRAHLIEGTAGDDQLIGTVGNDVLDGGAGNDLLAGDLGSDTYMFGQGSGYDQIYNHEPEGMTAPDRILLKPEVTAADVELGTRGQSTLMMAGMSSKNTGATQTGRMALKPSGLMVRAAVRLTTLTAATRPTRTTGRVQPLGMNTQLMGPN